MIHHCEVSELLGTQVDVTYCDPPFSAKVHRSVTSVAARAGKPGTRQRDLGFKHLTPELWDDLIMQASLTRRWSIFHTDLEAIGAWERRLDAAIPCKKQKRDGYVRGVAWPHDGGTVGDLPWVRWSMPQTSGDRPTQGAEGIVLAHAAGRCHWGGPGNLTHLVHLAMRGKGKHTTQKPLDQALDMVAWFSDPGELVGDWCAGRGTAAVACAILGREFIGCERDETEAGLAQERYEEALMMTLSPGDIKACERWIGSMQRRAEQNASNLPDDYIAAVLETLSWKGACWSLTGRRFHKGLPVPEGFDT